MSRSTISTFHLFALFPDEHAARVYLEARIWPNGVKCPDCGLACGHSVNELRDVNSSYPRNVVAEVSR